MKQAVCTTPVTIAASVLLAVITGSVTAGSGTGREWLPFQPWYDSSQYQVVDRRVPGRYDPVLLSLGHSVYVNLRRARQAALDREATNLQVAIRAAIETVHRLQLPAEYTLLREQLKMIRNDLQDRSKQLDKEPWVPVEAGIDDVLVYSPWHIKARSHAAIRKARAAAAAGDRKRVAEQLDVVSSTLEYSLGLFPLDKVKADLDSAQASASLNPPDWSGALQAVQSALVTFHWYTRVPARALLSAYNDVVNAYVLATGPVSAGDRHREIIGDLTRAQRELDGIADGKALAGEVRELIDRDEPQGDAIKSLLGHIQTGIRAEQVQAEIRYWKSIGPDTPE